MYIKLGKTNSIFNPQSGIKKKSITELKGKGLCFYCWSALHFLVLAVFLMIIYC